MGGIGKTSIALAVLHHNHIKEQFGDNRWFIRCDQFPTSCTNFLNRLSKVIGAGVENPEDLTPLRPFLSSREMILFLDNAESILDPHGVNASEIYDVVKELSQFSNIFLCITSRISTIPPACKILDIPTLQMEAAHDTFHHIYKGGGQSGVVNRILKQLDYHPLSITLLATVACHNRWDTNQLVREWERQQIDMLHTQHNESLAATIELSLASPMFKELGTDARDLLGVIAFFPQGVNEKNIDWLFPTLSNRTKIFDSFCILSLTYRSKGFVRIKAPLRDYLCPKNPASSPLLQMAKGRYFYQLSLAVNFAPGWPGFEEAQWIVMEDENVEHLLDIFTSIDKNSASVWDACVHFMEHLYWHKQRLVVFGPKIEELPDNHPSKPQCLYQLSWLFGSVGNHMEEKRLLNHALKLWKEQGNNLQVAETLKCISAANRWLGLHKGGIQSIMEALRIFEQLGNIIGQAYSWQELSRLLCHVNQLDAAEAAASKAINVINLLSNEDDWYLVCWCYCIFGNIYFSKGEVKWATSHLWTAFRIASHFNWHNQLFWCHYSLAQLFSSLGRFGDAQSHIEYAKSHVINDKFNLECVMQLQSSLWYTHCRSKEAEPEALHAYMLRSSDHKLGFSGELLEMVHFQYLLTLCF